VVAGEIPAGKFVVHACRRHLADLARQTEDTCPFRFDEAKANRACKFIEALPHVKGRWAAGGEKLLLAPWQKFIICNLFGWIKKVSGFYRYRIAYICVARKNAKSTLGAAIGLYKLVAEREFGAEVYSGATTEEQAWEVFRPAKNMAERTPELINAFGISVHAKSITVPATGSRFRPIIGNPGDGASPSCAIVDEFHEHTSDALYTTMFTGMAARDNPLLLVITTAGSDRSGPCYALQIEVQKVLSGVLENDSLFGIIYGIDPDDDWTAADALVKANPNLGISVGTEFLEDAQRDAVQSARKQNAFKTKHLNMWVNADIIWMNMISWEKAGDPLLSMDQFAREEPCIIGVDLASRVDIAAKIYLFRRVIDGADHYYAFGVYYLNEKAIHDACNSHYYAWAIENKLVRTPGNVTDYNWIADGILADGEKLIVREVPHDPYHAAALIQFIQARPNWDHNVVFVEVRQTVQQMSPPMKELEALVASGRFHHDGDPILAWMISNVVCHRDRKENIYPNKDRPENKIDGVIALLMALNRWMAQPRDESSAVEVW